MLITKEIEIDMGHRISNHKSKCRNFHGHKYVIEVGVDDKVITIKGASDEGMVIDFGDLKQIMMDEIDAKFDHGFVMWQNDEYFKIFDEIRANSGMKIWFVPFIPTAENLAKYWYELIRPKLIEKQIQIHHVRVWETRTSSAIYQDEDI